MDVTHIRLDGGIVSIQVLDPNKHEFFGMYRPPMPRLSRVGPNENTPVIGECPCGAMLFDNDQIREHWMKGCFDIPQYVEKE